MEMVIPWQLCLTIGPLLRDYPWQTVKRSQWGILLKRVNFVYNFPPKEQCLVMGGWVEALWLFIDV